jgi:oligopeptide/dipeptide ABC transporter ATP-binding protein
MVRAPLLDVEDLQVRFPSGQRGETVKAVDGVTLSVAAGETLGIIGESGSGKSTLGRAMAGFLRPTHGRVLHSGADPAAMSGREFAEKRRAFQIVFQDPNAALDPRMTIGQSVREPLDIVNVEGRAQRDLRVLRLLDRVGLDAEFALRYPHELSGGQKQRVNIARALAIEPRMVILDEAVSALDKSVEAQVLNLLRALKQQFNLTYLFISHDLNTVRYISDRVLVMYLGRVVELGPADPVYDQPRHPYTGALLSAVPIADPSARKDERTLLSGDVPSPANPPSACRFHTRCPKAQELCSIEDPPLQDKGTGTEAACHFPLSREEVAAIGVRSAR